RPVEGGRVLRGAGENGDVLAADLVEGVADDPDLTVHHPAGAHHMGPGVGLDLRHLGVPLERGVVVDPPLLVQHPAVPVVGGLVQAQVGQDKQPAIGTGSLPALAHEGREDEVGGVQPGLGDHPTHRRRGPQTPGPSTGKGSPRRHTTYATPAPTVPLPTAGRTGSEALITLKILYMVTGW